MALEAGKALAFGAWSLGGSRLQGVLQEELLLLIGERQEAVCTAKSPLTDPRLFQTETCGFIFCAYIMQDSQFKL